jgi:hypothetical protein
LPKLADERVLNSQKAMEREEPKPACMPRGLGEGLEGGTEVQVGKEGK